MFSPVRYQISTLATKLGVRNIAFLGSGLLVANYIAAIAVAFLMPQVILLLRLSSLVACFLLLAKETNPTSVVHNIHFTGIISNTLFLRISNPTPVNA